MAQSILHVLQIHNWTRPGAPGFVTFADGLCSFDRIQRIHRSPPGTRFNEDSRKKIHSLSCDTVRVKLNKSFYFFFFISRVVSISRVIRVIYLSRNFFYRRLRKINDGFGEHFELINQKRVVSSFFFFSFSFTVRNCFLWLRFALGQTFNEESLEKFSCYLTFKETASCLSAFFHVQIPSEIFFSFSISNSSQL